MKVQEIIGYCLLRGGRSAGLALLVSCMMPSLAGSPDADAAAGVLAKEVASRGWILFCARSGQGDYDLFLSRPDGSDRRNITQTPDANEFGGRFSPDSKRILYRRQPKGATKAGESAINHDLW